MSEQNSQIWKRLFHKNCKEWSPKDQGRYLNVPNDPDDVDDEELQSCRDLIREINRKPPIE